MGALQNKQTRFSLMFLALQAAAAVRCIMDPSLSYVLEEVYRHPSATHGAEHSLHRLKLAGHILLFRDGDLLRDPAEYAALGSFWQMLGGTWGGQWGDGVHFSLEHAGRK